MTEPQRPVRPAGPTPTPRPAGTPLPRPDTEAGRPPRRAAVPAEGVGRGARHPLEQRAAPTAERRTAAPAGGGNRRPPPGPFVEPAAAAAPLARRVAALARCSRSEAEWLIEGGFVTVDGVVAERPREPVGPQARVALAPGARAEPPVPVTVLWHQPAREAAPGTAGAPPDQWLRAETRSPQDPVRQPLLQRHRRHLDDPLPLDARDGGLVVCTQHAGVRRRLVEDRLLLEQEWMAELAGDVPADALERLRARGWRVSIGSQRPGHTVLRLALKGAGPGGVRQACEAAGLARPVLRRTRIGRVPLAGLAPGEWRFLAPGERF